MLTTIPSSAKCVLLVLRPACLDTTRNQNTRDPLQEFFTFACRALASAPLVSPREPPFPKGGDAMPRARRAAGSPVTVYISEQSSGSHRTMRIALGHATEFFGGSDPDLFRWERL